MRPRAVFVLSTGRCGTQWLARHLGNVYGDLAVVEHEPLHDGYRVGTGVVDHVARIEHVIEQRTYIETGWPAWRALPMLADRFDGRFAVVHLTRHPVPLASSWVTHGMYRPPILPGIHPEKVPASPFDDGAAFPEYRELWPALDPFQKCVYLWAEINRLGITLMTRADVPSIRLRYEDLFLPTTLRELTEFLGLPLRDELAAATGVHEDRFEFLTDIWWDVASPARLPHVADLAAELGYDLADVDEAALRRRYLAFG